MFEEYLSLFQSFGSAPQPASQPERELEFEPPTPEQFWSVAAKVPHLGDPASLMRHQWNVLRNDAWRQANVPPLSFVGAASQRAVQNYLYSGSYQPQERLNREGQRSTRRGSGPGAGNIFRERKDWDEVGVIPFEDGRGSVCGFTFFEGNRFIPADLVHKPVRSRGSEGGLAMLASIKRRTIKALDGKIFIMRDPIAAVRAQLRWLKDLSVPIPLVVFRHDEQQQTRSAWDQLPPSQRILITDEVSTADIFQARLANARIVACPQLVNKMAEHGNLHWVLRKAVEFARPWRQVLRELLGTKPVAEAEALFAQMEWSAAERAQFYDRSEGWLKKKVVAWYPDVSAPRVMIGQASVIERANGWFEEDTGALISPVIRIRRILRSANGKGVIEGHVDVEGEPQQFQVSASQVEQKGLLSAVSRELKRRGIAVTFKRNWSHDSYDVACGFSEPPTVERADVVGCAGHDFRFPSFGITYHGFRAEEASPLPCRIRPCERLEPPADLATLDLGPISSALPGVGLFWAVLRIFTLYALAPLYRLRLPACVLLGEKADDLAKTIADSFDTLRLTAPGRLDADAAFRNLSVTAARHTWPTVILLPERRGEVGSRLLGALPDKQAFIAALPGLHHSSLNGHKWWSIQVHEFDHAKRLIERLALPVLLHYLKDLKSRQCNYADWSTDWKICAWKDLGIWFGRLSRSREARNQCEKLIHFSPE